MGKGGGASPPTFLRGLVRGKAPQNRRSLVPERQNEIQSTSGAFASPRTEAALAGERLLGAETAEYGRGAPSRTRGAAPTGVERR